MLNIIVNRENNLLKSIFMHFSDIWQTWILDYLVFILKAKLHLKTEKMQNIQFFLKYIIFI